jgi:hypothetical protein
MQIDVVFQIKLSGSGGTWKVQFSSDQESAPFNVPVDSLVSSPGLNCLKLGCESE